MAKQQGNAGNTPVQWEHIVGILKPGDIGATKGGGFLPSLHRRFFIPYTDRFHHMLIGLPTYDGDMTIYESIPKGIAVGRLSFYRNSDIKFYRVTCDSSACRKSVDEVAKFGRGNYDYWLITKIAVYGIFKLLKKGFRKLRPEDIPYHADDTAYICTEAVDMSYWNVGVKIIPAGKAPVPAAFREAELEGRIKEIAHWQGMK